MYASHLKELGFNFLKRMTFLKLKDFMKIPCKIPAPHRRMIMNAVLKMQTPESKAREKNIETPDSEDIVIAKRKKIACNSSACSTSTANTSAMKSNLEPRKLFDGETIIDDDEVEHSKGNQMQGKQ